MPPWGHLQRPRQSSDGLVVVDHNDRPAGTLFQLDFVYYFSSRYQAGTMDNPPE